MTRLPSGRTTGAWSAVDDVDDPYDSDGSGAAPGTPRRPRPPLLTVLLRALARSRPYPFVRLEAPRRSR